MVGFGWLEQSSTPEILYHKNIQLAVCAKRLRKKLKRAEGELASLKKNEQHVQAIVSSINRAAEEFTKGCCEILPNFDFKLDEKEANAQAEEGDDSADVRSALQLMKRLYGRSSRVRLLKSVVAAVPEVGNEGDDGDNDDDNDDEEEEKEAHFEKLPELVEKQASKNVRLMLGALRKVSETVLGVGDAAKEEASKRIIGTDPSSLRAQLRRAEAIISLYEDRLTVLENQVRKFRDESEDSQKREDLMLRRLTLLCNNAMSEAAATALAEKMGATSNSSSAAAAPADAAAPGQKDGAAGGEGTASSAELEEAVGLAQARLKELEKVLEEKKGLIAQVEKMRADAALAGAEQSAAASAQEEGPTASADVSVLRGEISSLKADLHLASQEKAGIQAMLDEATAAIEKEKATFTEFIKTTETEHAASSKEKDRRIAQLRQKKRREDAEAALEKGLAERAQHLQGLLDAATLRADTLEKEVKRLRESPAANVYKQKLDEALANKWPNAEDAEKLSKAKMEADLQALRETEEGNAAVTEELEGIINETEEKSAQLAAQNAALLASLEEKEKDSKRWMDKYLNLNEMLGQTKHQLTLREKQYGEERRSREESDEQFAALKEQLAAQERVAKQAEQAARAATEEAKASAAAQKTIEKARDAAVLKFEGLKTTVKDLEKSNAAFRTQFEEAKHEKTRAEEDRKKVKRKYERSKSSLMLTTGAGGDLRMQGMDNALRCPLRSEYWKDCIITKCSHLFSRKALEDNLASRNRKCPTCKRMFNKEDIRDVFLYQKNEYDD